MTKPLIGVFDCEIQKQIVREMNDEEYAQHLLDLEIIKQRETTGE